MPNGDDLVPLKRVLDACGVSRATLWRVSRSGVSGFPAGVKRGGRIYWSGADIETIKQAIEEFSGRTVFEQRRRVNRAEKRRESLLAMKDAKVRGPRVRSIGKRSVQGDLFGR